MQVGGGVVVIRNLWCVWRRVVACTWVVRGWCVVGACRCVVPCCACWRWRSGAGAEDVTAAGGDRGCCGCCAGWCSTRCHAGQPWWSSLAHTSVRIDVHSMCCRVPTGCIQPRAICPRSIGSPCSVVAHSVPHERLLRVPFLTSRSFACLAAHLDRRYDQATQDAVRSAAYDGLLLAMLEQLRSLDIAYSQAPAAAAVEGIGGVEEASAASGADPLLGEGLVANNPAEMQRFINLAGGRRGHDLLDSFTRALCSLCVCCVCIKLRHTTQHLVLCVERGQGSREAGLLPPRRAQRHRHAAACGSGAVEAFSGSWRVSKTGVASVVERSRAHDVGFSSMCINDRQVLQQHLRVLC